VPALLTAGVLSGAGWAIAGQWMPSIAVSLVALAALAWWRATRRSHRNDCTGGENCSCPPG
jgi:mercuric ion transport protein